MSGPSNTADVRNQRWEAPPTQDQVKGLVEAMGGVFVRCHPNYPRDLWQHVVTKIDGYDSMEPSAEYVQNRKTISLRSLLRVGRWYADNGYWLRGSRSMHFWRASRAVRPSAWRDIQGLGANGWQQAPSVENPPTRAPQFIVLYNAQGPAMYPAARKDMPIRIYREAADGMVYAGLPNGWGPSLTAYVGWLKYFVVVGRYGPVHGVTYGNALEPEAYRQQILRAFRECERRSISSTMCNEHGLVDVEAALQVTYVDRPVLTDSIASYQRANQERMQRARGMARTSLNQGITNHRREIARLESEVESKLQSLRELPDDDAPCQDLMDGLDAAVRNGAAADYRVYSEGGNRLKVAIRLPTMRFRLTRPYVRDMTRYEPGLYEMSDVVLHISDLINPTSLRVTTLDGMNHKHPHVAYGSNGTPCWGETSTDRNDNLRDAHAAWNESITDFCHFMRGFLGNVYGDGRHSRYPHPCTISKRIEEETPDAQEEVDHAAQG